MQGLWKDKRYNFVKDKAHLAKSSNAYSKFRHVKYYEYDSNTFTESMCNLVFGHDISYKLIFNAPKRKRISEKIVQKAKRTKVRDYIKKGDFEKEVPQIRNYEKTAAWMWD